MATAPDDTSQTTEEDVHKATEEDIRKAIDGLDPDELDHLFANLGIPQYMISLAKKDANTDNTILKARAVLYMWRSKKGREFTRDILFDEREQILKKRTGTSGRYIEDLDLRKCQDQLLHKYLGTDMKVKLTPWDPDHTVYMDAIFVDLEMVKDEVFPSQAKQISLKENEELLTLETDTGLRVNRILIQGDAGSGKSTLLDNIAYKWALQLKNRDSSQSSSKSPLLQFDLVFVIHIHEIDELNDSLEEIIFKQNILKKCANISQNSLKSYLESNEKRCLFLVDGLNEDSVGILKSKTAEMSHLLYNNLYIQSCVIASIRPEKLQAMGLNHGMFTKVKLIGFSDANIEEYIRKYFDKTNVNYNSLLLRLIEDTHVWDLSGTPLLLLLFCMLWNSKTVRSLPNTRTKLYQETIASLWKKYHFEKLGLSEEDVSSDNLITELTMFLEVLGQVTLDRFLDDQSMEKVLFNDKDFKETELSLAMKVGLITKERIRSEQHIKIFFKFVHSSFQDFCSAQYLSNLQTQNNEKCEEYVAKLVHSTPWYDRGDDVTVFCAGLSPESTKLMTRQLTGHIDILKCASHQGRLIKFQDTIVVLPEYIPNNTITSANVDATIDLSIVINLLFIIAFEAQLTFEQCDGLASIMSTADSPCCLKWMLDRSFEKCIYYHLNLLKPITKTNTGLLFSNISRIHFYNPPIDFPRFYCLLLSMLKYTNTLSVFHLQFTLLLAPNQMFDFSDLFDKLAHLENLEDLVLQRFTSGSITDGDVDITNTLHKLCHFKLYSLMLVHVTVSATSVAELLTSSKSLKKLTIVMPEGSTMLGTFNMMRVISNIQTLSNLSLVEVAIGRGVKYLKCIIPQLECLQLSAPSFDVWDLHELASYLKKGKLLTTLLVSGTNIDTAIFHLADQLKHLVNLKELILADTNLWNHCCQILADGIKAMPSLCSIDLTRNRDIGLEGRKAIKDTLSQFQQLEIEFDPIPAEAYVFQAQADIRFQSALNAASYIRTEASPHLVSLLTEKLREAELIAINLVKASTLPDCCRCMSQLYNDVRR